MSNRIDRRDACDAGKEMRPLTWNPSSSASSCGLKAISFLLTPAIILFFDFHMSHHTHGLSLQNSLGIPLPVRFDFENEVYYKRTVSIEDVCSACHSIDRRHRQRGILVRARMIQLHMRNGPIDVQKKTGQQRLPRHLNSIFHDSQIKVRKMHSIAACTHTIHSFLS